MAERRMFAKSIIDSDIFLDMPSSTQNLYFHLAMRADDDGFVNSPQRIMRTVSCSKNDMDMLVFKNFVIPFESGICVIKHWRIHNYLRNDRYRPTIYTEEKNKLSMDDSRGYVIGFPSGLPTGIPNDIPEGDAGKVRLGKDSIGKERLGKEDHVSPVGDSVIRFSKPSLEEVVSYCKERDNGIDAEKWFDYYTSNGWKVGKSSMKDWKAAVRTWEKNVGGKPRGPKLEAAYRETAQQKIERMIKEAEDREKGIGHSETNFDLFG